MTRNRIVEVFDSEAAEAESGAGDFPFEPTLGPGLRYEVRTTEPARRGEKSVDIDVYAGNRDQQSPASAVGLSLAAGTRVVLGDDTFTLADSLDWALRESGADLTVLWDPANVLGLGAAGTVLKGSLAAYCFEYDPVADGLFVENPNYIPPAPTRPRPDDATLAKFVKLGPGLSPANAGQWKPFVAANKRNDRYTVNTEHDLYDFMQKGRLLRVTFENGTQHTGVSDLPDQTAFGPEGYFWSDGNGLTFGKGRGFGPSGSGVGGSGTSESGGYGSAYTTPRFDPIKLWNTTMRFWIDPDTTEEYYALTNRITTEFESGILFVPKSVDTATLRFTKAATLTLYQGQAASATVTFAAGDAFPYYDGISHIPWTAALNAGVEALALDTPQANPQLYGAVLFLTWDLPIGGIGYQGRRDPLVVHPGELYDLLAECRAQLLAWFDAFIPVFTDPAQRGRLWALLIHRNEDGTLSAPTVPALPNVRYTPRDVPNSERTLVSYPARTVVTPESGSPYVAFAIGTDPVQDIGPADIRGGLPRPRGVDVGWQHGVRYSEERTSYFISRILPDGLFDEDEWVAQIAYAPLRIPFTGLAEEQETETEVGGGTIDGPLEREVGVQAAIFPTVSNLSGGGQTDIRRAWALVAIPAITGGIPTKRTMNVEEPFGILYPTNTIVGLLELLREAVDGADTIWAEEVSLESDEQVVSSFGQLRVDGTDELRRQGIIQRDTVQRVTLAVPPLAPVQVGRLVRDGAGRVWRITAVDRRAGPEWQITATRRLAGKRRPSPYGLYPVDHQTQRR